MWAFLLPKHKMLKCREIPWIENEEVAELVKRNPEKLDQEEMVKLIRALDTRLMRMWDKVAFERYHDLVDYGKLPPRTA